MTVSLRDARDHAKDREWIQSVYRDYLDDLRARKTGLFPVLGAVGLAEPGLVLGWLADRRASLLTILENHEPAGFAMVVSAPGDEDVDYRMTEFFIDR